ncbi:DUF421 domain-containing protein [Pseudalkalibacillus sp. SCS-8]|uniref:DUF421 domain-containing protein n=1 Tax=Pseudalkalibacillus nanhaiensis TaxID=3115291 RepID=UPI0032DB5F1A
MQLTLELILGFAGLFIVTRLLGKTQISQITPFDFISSLILGELLGNAIYDENVHIFSILYALIVWGLLIFLIEFWTQKKKGVRGLLEGQPVIVIHKGKLVYPALKKSKLDINQLQGLIRQKGYFTIYDVEYAILETNGTVSVLPKSNVDMVKREDMELPEEEVTLPISLILDGEIVYDNLQELGRNEAWLKKKLLEKDIVHVGDVLHAEWQSPDELFITKHTQAKLK